LWATDCPVGAFNQTKESYQKNLQIFIEKINKHFKDTDLLEKLLYKNCCALYDF
jgi:hypothetical protein